MMGARKKHSEEINFFELRPWRDFGSLLHEGPEGEPEAISKGQLIDHLRPCEGFLDPPFVGAESTD